MMSIFNLFPFGRWDNPVPQQEVKAGQPHSFFHQVKKLFSAGNSAGATPLEGVRVRPLHSKINTLLKRVCAVAMMLCPRSLQALADSDFCQQIELQDYALAPGEPVRIPLDLVQLFGNDPINPNATLEYVNGPAWLTLQFDFPEIGTYYLTDGLRTSIVNSTTLAVIEKGALHTLKVSLNGDVSLSGSVSIDDPREALVLDDGRLVVAAGMEGLLVYDSMERLNLQKIIPSTNALGLALNREEHILLLADGTGGGKAYDVRGELRLMATDESIIDARQVAESKGVAYFASGPEGVCERSVNATHLLSPLHCIQLVQKDPVDVFVQDEMIYLVGRDPFILRVARATETSWQGWSIFLSNPQSVTGWGDTIQISDNEAGLIFLQPKGIVGQMTWDAVVRDSRVTEDRIFVTTSQALHVLDRQQRQYSLQGTAEERGQYELTFNLTFNRQVIKTATISLTVDQPPLAVLIPKDQTTKPGVLFEVQKQGDFLLSHPSDQLMTYSVEGSSPFLEMQVHPKKLGSAGAFWQPQRIIQRDNMVYLADDIMGRLAAFDATDPKNLLQSHEVILFPRDIVVSENYLIATGTRPGTILFDRASLTIIDQFDPQDDLMQNVLALWESQNVVFMGGNQGVHAFNYTSGTLDLLWNDANLGNVRKMIFDEARQWLFMITDKNLLTILDVGDLTAPEKRFSFSQAPAENGSLALKGQLLFLSQDGELRIYDISDLDDVILIKTLNFSFINEVKIYGNYLFIVSGGGGVEIIYIFDPCHPRTIGKISPKGKVWDVSVDWDRRLLFLTLILNNRDGDGAIHTYDMDFNRLFWTLSGRPDISQIGNHRISFCAQTQLGAMECTEPFTWEVLGSPLVAKNITNQFNRVGESIVSIDLFQAFIQPNRRPIAVSAYGMPEGITFNPLSREFSGSSPVAGKFPITLVAEAAGATAEQTFLMQFNYLPQSQVLPPKICREGRPCQVEGLDKDVVDRDGDPLTTTLSFVNDVPLSAPFFQGTNGSIAVDTSRPGQWMLLVRYSDLKPDGRVVQQNLQIIVEAEKPPRVAKQISSQQGKVGQKLIVNTQEVIVDDNGDPLSCGITLSGRDRELPKKSAFHAATQEFEWVPQREHLNAFTAKQIRFTYFCNDTSTEFSVYVDGMSDAEIAATILSVGLFTYLGALFWNHRYSPLNWCSQSHCEQVSVTVGKILHFPVPQPGKVKAMRLCQIKPAGNSRLSRLWSSLFGSNGYQQDIPHPFFYDPFKKELSSVELESLHEGNYQLTILGAGRRILVKANISVTGQPSSASHGSPRAFEVG